MRFLWYLIFVGAVASEDGNISHVPGCEDVPTESKEKSPVTPTTVKEPQTPESTPKATTTSTVSTTQATTTSTVSTTQETTTPTTTTTKKGAREEEQRKYGFYREGGCLYKVLSSYDKLYPADCMYACNRYPTLHRFYDGFRCLKVLERRVQERQYRSSMVCRTGRCLRGVCVPDGYVQKCTIPSNSLRLSQRPQYNRYE
uniref:Evasin n=1 Tax=Rhipicephalus pulchellus TaxID=72859 RepID=L7LTB2_RHIPC